MALFSKVTVTTSGLALIAESQAYGDALTFTAVALGQGRPEDGDDIEAYGALKDEKMRVSVSRIEKTSDAQYAVRASFDNSGLAEGFYMSEIGLYAKTGGDEVLFGYAYAEEGKADYLPSKDIPQDVMEWAIYTTVGNASNVTAVIPPETCARAVDLENHIKDLSAHADVFSKYLKIADLPSMGIVDGNVSNAEGWWVKFGGKIPLIVQGIHKAISVNYSSTTVTLPVVFPNAGLLCQVTDYDGYSAHGGVIASKSTVKILANFRGTFKLDILAIGY